MLACALHVRIYRVLLTIFTFSHGLVDLTMVLYTSSDSVSGWFPSPADRGFRPNVITYWALMAPECLDRTLIGAQRGPHSNQNINYQIIKSDTERTEQVVRHLLLHYSGTPGTPMHDTWPCDSQLMLNADIVGIERGHIHTYY